MLLLTHIIIALASILQATYTLVRPTRGRMHLTYGLVTATLVSGVVLVWQLHVPLMQPCLSGILYLGMVGGLLFGANYRLVHRAVHVTDWSHYLDD